MTKPFLKWAGGKQKLAPFIAEHLSKTGANKGGRLVEPFAGSASVSLAVDFDEYYLNDTNADLIALYQSLKNDGKAFVDYAQSFFCPENNREARFYELRAAFNDSQDPKTRSALFLYLNRHGFNGLCRYNRQGLFNVPFGKYAAPYFPKDELIAFVEKSPKMRFFCGDFEAVFAKTDPKDAIYCDPPYLPLSDTANFTAYHTKGFDLDDQRRLAALCQTHADRGQKILVSNHDTPLVYELYQGAIVKKILAQRNISAKGSNRKKVGEILAVFG